MKKDFYRGRRLRQSGQLRDLVRETVFFTPAQLVMPYFVVDTEDAAFEREIGSMPGQFQLSVPRLLERIGRAREHGLAATLLFGIPAGKDEQASSAWDRNGIVQKAVREIKRKFPDLVVITDDINEWGNCITERLGLSSNFVRF